MFGLILHSNFHFLWNFLSLFDVRIMMNHMNESWGNILSIFPGIKFIVILFTSMVRGPHRFWNRIFLNSKIKSQYFFQIKWMRFVKFWLTLYLFCFSIGIIRLNHIQIWAFQMAKRIQSQLAHLQPYSREMRFWLFITVVFSTKLAARYLQSFKQQSQTFFIGLKRIKHGRISEGSHLPWIIL